MLERGVAMSFKPWMAEEQSTFLRQLPHLPFIPQGMQPDRHAYHLTYYHGIYQRGPLAGKRAGQVGRGTCTMLSHAWSEGGPRTSRRVQLLWPHRDYCLQVSGHFVVEVSDTIFPDLRDHQFGQQTLMPGMGFVEVSGWVSSCEGEA
jgi:hypothetical protein